MLTDNGGHIMAGLWLVVIGKVWYQTQGLMKITVTMQTNQWTARDQGGTCRSRGVTIQHISAKGLLYTMTTHL